MPRLLTALAQLALGGAHAAHPCCHQLSLDVAVLVALERTELPRVSAGGCGLRRIQDGVLVSVRVLSTVCGGGGVDL